MSEIVKVQQALFPSGTPALIYDKARKYLRQMRLSDDVLRKMEDSPKVYFHATWTGKEWALGDRAPEQSW